MIYHTKSVRYINVYFISKKITLIVVKRKNSLSLHPRLRAEKRHKSRVVFKRSSLKGIPGWRLLKAGKAKQSENF